jgi:hypothetical protein
VNRGEWITHGRRIGRGALNIAALEEYRQRLLPILAVKYLGPPPPHDLEPRDLPARSGALFLWHLTPSGIVGGAMLGVYVWRLLGEMLTEPFNRRGNLGMWQRALAANADETVRYFLERDPDQ